LPLRALLNGKDFLSPNLTKENRNEDYLCPVCKKKFVSVIPSCDIIKYFRHEDGTEHFGEPESMEHLKTKLRVYYESQAIGWSSILEHPIGDHVTDVAVWKPNENGEIDSIIAVEIQCSPISYEEYKDRNFTYMRYDFDNLWLFAGTHFSHINERFEHDRGYDIQRALRLHRIIMKEQNNKYACINRLTNKVKEFNGHPLYTIGNSKYYHVTNFQRRFKASTLGWYKKEPIALSQILTRYIA
jgi:competence CoiA-like predicted nuclease